jgi:membrane protease YdiL (CAAX protease family)
MVPVAANDGRMRLPSGRLWGWLALVGAIAGLNFASRFAGDDDDSRTALYMYSTAVAGAIFYAIFLGLVLLLARGLDLREVFALRAPPSWGRALLLVLGSLAAIFAVSYALYRLGLRGGEEQGIVPDEWDPDRAGAYAANFVVIAIFGPIVEELTYRGLGQYLLDALYGTIVALVGTAVLFGLAHGLVEGFLALAFFGLAAAWLRLRTASIYPPMVMHMIFNGLALIAAVSVDTDL